MPLETDHDQAKTRQSMFYTDGHGRAWHAVIDVKSMAPVGRITPQFDAPLIPEPKYVRLVPGQFARLVIAYDRWVEDLDRAHAAWTARLREIAHQKFGDAAAQAVENRHPHLMALVGPKPQPVEPVLAAQAGEPWVLGLAPREPMPAWARPFFATESRRPAPADRLAFLRQGEAAEEPAPDYPVHKGFGRWLLSDGTTFEGKKEEARAAEAALHQRTQPERTPMAAERTPMAAERTPMAAERTPMAAEPVPAEAGVGVHPSWNAGG